MLRSRGGQVRAAVVYENAVELLPEGKVYPLRTTRPRNGKLQEEVFSLLKSLPPVQYVFVADPLLSEVRESAAKNVPLGQGEESWKVEIARDWGVKSQEVRARHYPTAYGALVAAVFAEDLKALHKSKGVRGVYPLPLAVASASRGFEGNGFLVFWRPEYLLLVGIRGGEVAGLQTTVSTSVTPDFLQGELALQSRVLLGGLPQRVCFVDSPPLDVGQEVELESLSVLLSPPKELGWEKETTDLQAFVAALYGLLAGGVLIVAPTFYFARQAADLRAQIQALESEKQVLQAELSREPAVRKRVADLEALLKSTSTESPVYRALLDALKGTPADVLISKAVFTSKEANLVLHSKSAGSLSEALSAYTKALGVPPGISKLSAEETGWKSLQVSFTLKEAP